MAANWKMNGSKAMARDFFTVLKSNSEQFSTVDIAIFPPYVYLTEAENLLKGSKVAWGAQNMSEKESGAYTGEISAAMLLDYGCQYVIIGHSERRQYYGETDELVAKKVSHALISGLKPILCVGETLEEREAGKTLKVVKEQLDAVLAKAQVLENLGLLTVAYEPVWAIGTGKTPRAEEAQEVHFAIRSHVAQQDAKRANAMRILYGGSLKPENAKDLLAMEDIDGGLIGGASLQVDSFLSLCDSAMRV